MRRLYLLGERSLHTREVVGSIHTAPNHLANILYFQAFFALIFDTMVQLDGTA